MVPALVLIIVNSVISGIGLLVGVLQNVKIKSACFKKIGRCFCSSEPKDSDESE